MKFAPSAIRNSVRTTIREQAIRKTKVKIALASKVVADYSEEQLEILVAEEEQNMKKSVGQTSLIVIAALFGVTFF